MGKISLAEKIFNFLEDGERDINKLIDKTKETGTKWSKKRIETYIKKTFKEDEVFWDYIITNNKIYYRGDLVQNTKFKIKLTNEEFNEKKLFIGHRFIPFVPDDFYTHEITLLDKNDNEIKIYNEVLGMADGMKYFTFLGLDFLTSEMESRDEDAMTDGELDDNGIPKINLNYFDLKEWAKENNLKKTDYIQIEVDDFDSLIYKIEKITVAEFNKQKLLIKRKDAELEEAILSAIKEVYMIPVPSLLFKALTLSDDYIVKELGSPISTLINTSEKITIGDNFVRPHLEEDGVPLVNEIAKNIEIPTEQGKAKSIEGILKELGISMLEEFVEALIVQNFMKNKKVDVKEVFEKLFENRAYLFANKQQLDNYNRAFDKLQKKIVKNWKNVKFEKNNKELFDLCIDTKMEITLMLRQIDNYLLKTGEEFDFSIMMQFSQIETIVENLVGFILREKGQLPTIEVVKILKQMKPTLKNVKKDVQKVKDEYK